MPADSHMLMYRQRVSACAGDACKLAGFGAPPALVFSCFGLQQMPEPHEVPPLPAAITHAYPGEQRPIAGAL